MLYNQNNVATEANPFTTLIEKTVGEQLCKMLGYIVTPAGDPEEPVGSGHITCVWISPWSQRACQLGG